MRIDEDGFVKCTDGPSTLWQRDAVAATSTTPCNSEGSVDAGALSATTGTLAVGGTAHASDGDLASGCRHRDDSGDGVAGLAVSLRDYQCAAVHMLARAGELPVNLRLGLRVAARVSGSFLLWPDAPFGWLCVQGQDFSVRTIVDPGMFVVKDGGASVVRAPSQVRTVPCSRSFKVQCMVSCKRVPTLPTRLSRSLRA